MNEGLLKVCDYLLHQEPQKDISQGLKTFLWSREFNLRTFHNGYYEKLIYTFEIIVGDFSLQPTNVNGSAAAISSPLKVFAHCPKKHQETPMLLNDFFQIFVL